MAKFMINKEYDDPETVEADSFHTKGEFVDFVKWNGSRQDHDIVLRVRADAVQTVHMEDAAT